jgi:hypothetical protein
MIAMETVLFNDIERAHVADDDNEPGESVDITAGSNS